MSARIRAHIRRNVVGYVAVVWGTGTLCVGALGVAPGSSSASSAIAAAPSVDQRGAQAAALAPKRVPASVRRSSKREPRVRKVRYRVRGKGRVAVRIKVRYPRVGKRPGPARVRLRVWKNRAQTRLLQQLTRKTRRVDARETYSFVLSKKASRRVRRTLRKRSNRPRAHVVNFDVAHSRHLDRDPHVDHQLVTGFHAAGRSLRPPRRRGKARSAGQLGGFETTLHLHNQEAQRVVVSIGQGTCMYRSGLHALNDQVMPANQNGSWTSAQVAADDSTNQINAPGQNEYGETPEYAQNSIYSPELRNLFYEMFAEYDAVAPVHPRYFNEIRNVLPTPDFPGGFAQCDLSTNAIVVAFDGLGQSYHAGGVFRFQRGGLDQLALFQGNFGFGLASVPSDYTLAVGISEASVQPWIVNVGGRGCYTTQWMECMFGPGNPRPDSTRLVDVVWPGSHDSGTAGLLMESYDKNSTSCSQYHSVFGVVPAAVYGLAVNQTGTLREQLERGIRYLDLRTSFDTSSGEWRLVHTLFSGNALATELQDVAHWAATHPREPFIVDINHICTNGAPPSTYLPALKFALTAPRNETGLNLCEVAYQWKKAPSGQTRIPAQTIADMRSGNGSVLVTLKGQDDPAYYGDIPSVCPVAIADQDPVNYSSAEPADFQEGPYPNPAENPITCTDDDDAETINRAFATQNYMGGVNIENYRNQNPLNFFRSDIHYEFAAPDPINHPRSFDLLQNAISETHLVRFCPSSLLDWGESLMPGTGVYTRQEVLAEWDNCANIVGVDNALGQGFAGSTIVPQNTDYLRQIIHMNLGPNPNRVASC